MVNLDRWLDEHEVSIDDLGQEKVADVCREALWDVLKHDATIEYINNNTWEIIDELKSELPDLNIAEALNIMREVVKKHNGDWRILIQGPDKEEKEGYLRLVSEEYMFNPNTRNALDVIDWDEFVEAFESEVDDYLEANINNYEEEEWFMDWVYGGHDRDIEDSITPDDYYPLSNFAFEFPTSYDAEYLNEAMASKGLIFFKVNGVKYVALAAVGTSMAPALYYAYYVYSDLSIESEEIAKAIVRESPEYWRYIIGEDRLIELVKMIGYDLRELQKISKESYKEFEEALDALSKELKEGRMSKLEAFILGMLAGSEEPNIDSAKSS